ncbi:hypothetical protein WMY93_026986 [Mugilogobius chulae]|uniref:C1q domain-containing protein n=1 Tax=Mugilogobius chulae TaxID=88201 RepID=A0AAW0N1V5_9GOBI
MASMHDRIWTKKDGGVFTLKNDTPTTSLFDTIKVRAQQVSVRLKTHFSLKMENSLVFVLLLLCSFSSACKDRNKDERSPCLSDIHAALRDMTATLTEYKIKIEQLQSRNEAHESEMKNLKAQTNETKTDVAVLWRDRTIGHVAFSTSLEASGSGRTFGPFSSHTTLIYKHVFLNNGNAYNPNTGIFKAPVKGAYHFELYVAAHGQARATGALLMKNSEIVVMAFEGQGNGFSTAANGATLLLEANDTVYVKLWNGYVIFDNLNHHSTFSGHLLFPM